MKFVVRTVAARPVAVMAHTARIAQKMRRIAIHSSSMGEHHARSRKRNLPANHGPGRDGNSTELQKLCPTCGLERSYGVCALGKLRPACRGIVRITQNRSDGLQIRPT